MTRSQALAKARAAQFIGDVNFNKPFQMPARREPVRYSVALPRYFLEDLNEARQQLSRFSGPMRLVFEKLWTDSSDFREWLPEEVYHRVSRMKSDERANFLAGLLDEVVRNASQIIGQNGLPLELTPADYTARRTAVNNVADFARQAGKFYGFIRNQLDSANKPAPSGSKSHVPEGEGTKRRSSKSKKQRAADYAARSATD